MKKNLFLSIAFLILITISCSSNNETTNVLINDIWALESIGGVVYSRGEDQTQHPIIEIHLKDERLFGNTGCNDMNGTVKVVGSKITFSEITTTKMFCPGVDEINFLSSLKKANNYKIEKMRLYLFDDDKELLVFKKID
jgi:heat shock protein HslJ